MAPAQGTQTQKEDAAADNVSKCVEWEQDDTEDPDSEQSGSDAGILKYCVKPFLWWLVCTVS